ncbi:MAG: macro domain-containing protein [Anaerolineales bacterium]|nr:macro domain-containing protein [Anaerolineales bacterium]
MAERLAAYPLPNGARVALEHGDLTEAAVDAIVNAANAELQHGGGVAAAIVRRGGRVIQTESDAWLAAHGPAGHDRPALTQAGQLPARAVIHAVGPLWRGGGHGERAALQAAYAGALALAAEQGFASVAFPSISTGLYGYPVAQGAAIAAQAVADYFTHHPAGPVREVRFVLIDAPTVAAFQQALAAQFGPTA